MKSKKAEPNKVECGIGLLNERVERNGVQKTGVQLCASSSAECQGSGFN